MTVEDDREGGVALDKLTPAELKRHLFNYAARTLDEVTRENLEIVTDIHWIFLHSKRHKASGAVKKHIGKWKYDAATPADMYDKVKLALPVVAEGLLPVVKFTSLANVFSGERVVVAYCYPDSPGGAGGSDGAGAKRYLDERVSKEFYWGSDYFPAPVIEPDE